jgi:hypothetical protein
MVFPVTGLDKYPAPLGLLAVLILNPGIQWGFESTAANTSRCDRMRRSNISYPIPPPEEGGSTSFRSVMVGERETASVV